MRLKSSTKCIILVLMLTISWLLPACGLLSVPHTPSQQQLKVSLIFDIGGQGDCGFNDMAYMGAEKAVQELGDKIAVSTFKGSSAGDNREFLLRLQGQNKADLVICVGHIFTEPLLKIAPQFPQTKFVVIDGYIPDLKPDSNITCLLFREQEGSFLMGAAAALISETGRIGFIGGMVGPLIKNFEVGYIAGAKHINPNIDIVSDYIGTTVMAYWDPATARRLSSRQYESGADIIYHAAGASGIGVIEAAQEKNKLLIGVDSDQTLTVSADQRPFILTSMLKRVDTAVYLIIIEASKKNLYGGYSEFGLKEDGVGYADNEYNADLLSDIKDQLEQIKRSIINKEIIVPDNIK